MKLNQLILMLSLILFGLGSCQQEKASSEDALKYVPQEALSVTSMDVAGLMEKADFEAVKDMEMFKDMVTNVQEYNPSLAALLQDPASSGIDLEQPVYWVQTLNKDNPAEMFTALMGSVKDPAQVQETMKLFGSTEQSGEGFTYMEEKNNIVAWNNDLALLATSQGYMDLPAEVSKIFSTGEETNILNNPKIKAFTEAEHDLKSFATLDVIPDIADAALAISMAGIDPESLRGGYTYGYTDFEKGKIDGQANWSFKQEFTKHIAPFFKDAPKADLSKQLPAEDQLLLFSGALSPEGINLIFSERPQFKGMVNYGLQASGLKLMDFLKAMGGDLALAMYGKDMLMVTDIRDQEAFDKILNAGVQLNSLRVEGEGLYGLTDGSIDLYASQNTFLLDMGDYAYLSSNKDMLGQIQSGELKLGGDKQTAKLAKDNVMALYWNLQAFQQMAADEKISGGVDLENVLKTLNASHLEMNVTRDGMGLEAVMNDKEANALAVLLRTINTLYVEESEFFDEQLDRLEETPVLPEEDRVETQEM